MYDTIEKLRLNTEELNKAKYYVNKYQKVQEFQQKNEKVFVVITFMFFLILILFSFSTASTTSIGGVIACVLFSIVAAAVFALFTHIFNFLIFVFSLGDFIDGKEKEVHVLISTQFEIINSIITNKDYFHMRYIRDPYLIYSFDGLLEVIQVAENSKL